MTQSETAGQIPSSTAPVGGERSIRIVSWLFLGNGIVWGLGSIPYAIYINRLGSLPVIGPIESMAGPISELFGYEGVVWFLVVMGLLSWLEVLAGWWLRQGQKEGALLAFGLLPVSMFFWVGFLLPIWLVLGPVRIYLLARGWKTVR